MSDPVEKSSHYEVVVVGAGPAGISAAINLANRKKHVVVLDGQRPFSYPRKAPKIPNYPGFSFTNGEELARAFTAHLEEFGVPFFREKVGKLFPEEDGLTLFTDKDMYHAKVVILATGLYREADLEGEDELVGRGVAYCVSCDGRLFAGRDVAFVSYLEEGEEEAAVLATDFASSLTYIPLYPGSYEGLPEGVRVLARKRPARLFRDDGGKVHVAHPDEELVVDGVFVYRRSVSPHDLLDELVLRDGHIAVNRLMETSVPGVLAAGDCTGEPYQIAKAVGEGQMAAFQAFRLLREGIRAPAVVTPPAAEPPALKEEDRVALSRILAERLAEPVRLVHFTQLPGDGTAAGPPTDSCREARRLLEELAALSPLLELELHDLEREPELAAELGVERIPATLVSRAGEVPRLRFLGVPEGYEFGPLLEAVVDVSAGSSGDLSEETQAALKRLRRPVRLEVLTTSTCPVCPTAVRLAHRFALATPKVSADMVVASEFPDLVQRYQVSQVPRVVVQGQPAEPGRLDEARLRELVLEAGVRSPSR